MAAGIMPSQARTNLLVLLLVLVSVPLLILQLQHELLDLLLQLPVGLERRLPLLALVLQLLLEVGNLGLERGDRGLRLGPLRRLQLGNLALELLVLALEEDALVLELRRDTLLGSQF